MKAMVTEEQLFTRGGASFQAAWRILIEGCQYPPSFELFCHELKKLRLLRPAAGPEVCARKIADAYHLTEGFFRE